MSGAIQEFRGRGKALPWQSQPFGRTAWYGVDLGNLPEDVCAHISVPLQRWIFMSVSVKDLVVCLIENMAFSGNIPFSTSSGLLECFQVEDSHLLNHDNPTSSPLDVIHSRALPWPDLV